MANRNKKRKGRKRVERMATDQFADAAVLPGLSLRATVDAPPSLAFDPEKYRRHVEHLDMDDDQKTELMRAVWNIMQSFVDRAFGDDATQLATQSVGNVTAKDETGDSPVVGSSKDDLPDGNPDDLSCAFHHTADKRGPRKR